MSGVGPLADTWTGRAEARPLFPSLATVPWFGRGRRPRAQEEVLWKLRAAEAETSLAELAEARGRTRASVGRLLRALRGHGLAVRVRRGLWRAAANPAPPSPSEP